MHAFTRTTLAAIAIAALAATATLPAQAAAAPTANLITAQDLSTSFGPLESGSFGVSANDPSLSNPFCVSASGAPVEFPNSTGWDVTGRIKASKRYVDVSEIVLDYGSADAAAKAYQTLTTGAATCAPSARSRVPGTSRKTFDRVTQTLPSVPGAIAVQQRRVTVSPNPRANGSSVSSYTVYRLAGNAIVEVQYFTNPGTVVNAKTQAKVNALSVKAQGSYCRLLTQPGNGC